MWKPLWVDQNNNGIADSLDNEIVNRRANQTAGDYVNVIVALKSEPTARDADTFSSCGGYITTSPWKYAVYGFGGQIPYNRIANFAWSNPNVLLVEKEAIFHATIAYAASQLGARTRVWNTLGLQGDSNSSNAVVDSGIDDSDLKAVNEAYGSTPAVVNWDPDSDFNTDDHINIRDLMILSRNYGRST